MLELAKTLEMSTVHEGGLTTNLKEVKEVIALKIGTGKSSKADKEAKSQLAQALKEAIKEQDEVQVQLNEQININGRTKAHWVAKQDNWEAQQDAWKAKEVAWMANKGREHAVETATSNCEIEKLRDENDKLSLDLEVKERAFLDLRAKFSLDLAEKERALLDLGAVIRQLKIQL